ncbi:uncharacterized protein LOC130697832 [Daphnia carinata]|uniref:uncharacterized protein LOC130697832 n=1 Tax=Daphnia carinata TaxID=120202 RepID=UPI00257AACEA|nr:uncharacterized protein LOC130697832 [Daphnia carinata]
MKFNSIQICLPIILSILIVDPVPARVVVDPGVDQAGNGLYGGMVQGRQITALLTVTTTVSSVLTSTVSTSKLCMKLSTSGSLTPSSQCARNLRNGRQDDEPMLYVLYGENGEDFEFVRPDQINPAKVHRVEATELVQFRDGTPAEPAIESSLETDDRDNGVRVAQPVYFAALASLLSNIFPSALQSTTTSTITSTVYNGGTTFITIYTSTNSFVLIGSCYPSYPPLC